MEIDSILAALNRHEVRYLLIGGANFLLRHGPVLTYDVDIWIRDDAENRHRCAAALHDIDARWGRSESEWKPVSQHHGDWLADHPLFCMTTRHGPLDVFRFVDGLASWDASKERALPSATASGVAYLALCDEDMLLCQMALPEETQKLDRIRALQRAIRKDADHV